MEGAVPSQTEGCLLKPSLTSGQLHMIYAFHGSPRSPPPPPGRMADYDVGHNSFNVHSNSFTQFNATLRVQLIKRSSVTYH
jgi:hypothetical protein